MRTVIKLTKNCIKCGFVFIGGLLVCAVLSFLTLSICEAYYLITGKDLLVYVIRFFNGGI